jgi:hypothetical protein
MQCVHTGDMAELSRPYTAEQQAALERLAHILAEVLKREANTPKPPKSVSDDARPVKSA